MPERVAGGSSVAFSIASPYGTYQGLAALKRSGGLGVPITDEGIFEAQRVLASEEGLYAEPSAIVGVTAVMQLARQKAIDPDQTVVVVLTSGGLKDYGASRAWLPPVPSAARRTSPAPSASSKTAMASRSGRSLAVAFRGEDAPGHIAERARAAERAGFDSLWFIEDYFQTSAFAMAGAAAAVTARIGVGTAVVNPYTRHPALIAMEMATLAAIAPGRVVLGLGTGVRRWVEDQMGIPASHGLATLAECVDVVRRLWAGERVTHRGRAFTLSDVALEYKPAQPELPIVLGVKGPKALALAGAIADGVVCSIMSSPAHVRRARETVTAARAASPHPPCRILAYVPVAIGRDAAAARRRRPAAARALLRAPARAGHPGRGRRVRGRDARDPAGARPGRNGRRARHRRARRHLRARRLFFRQQFQKGVDIVSVELFGRRELPEDRPQLVAEFDNARAEKVRYSLAGLAKHAAVGDEAVALQGKYEAVRTFRCPFGEGRRPYRRVIGAVDLDGRHLPAGILQLLRLRQLLRIEGVVPGLEGPAAHAGADFSRIWSLWYPPFGILDEAAR